MSEGDLSGWRKLILECIQRLDKTIFTVDDILLFNDEFRMDYPNNHHIREKVRQALQNLRDDGYIAFVSRGKYMIVDTANNANDNTTDDYLSASRGDIEPNQRNPPWTTDELILALNLYVHFKGNPPGKDSPEIVGLSALLNRLAGPDDRADGFRNPNGVYMKLMNFRRFDPAYQAQGKTGLTRGNKLEQVVWDEFAHDPDRLRVTATAIERNLSEASDVLPSEIEIEDAEEGRVLTRAHLVRERSRRLVQAKKTEALNRTGKLACEACGFDFNATYGERGQGFIEVHHALPVHQLLPGSKTKLSDLHLLCANCHRMVHSRRPWLTLDDLKSCLGVL
jgi:5-methylcytosine-specific restriction enzyme A